MLMTLNKGSQTMQSNSFSNFFASRSAIVSWLLAIVGAGLLSASAQTAAPAAEPKAMPDSTDQRAVSAEAPAPKPILVVAQSSPTSQASPAASSSSQTANTTAPTYLGNVLPIIMRRCSRCHNEQARFVYNW